MMEKFEGYSTRDLLDHHNAVASDVDKPSLSKWKGKKEDLVARILELEAIRDGRPSEEELLDHGELAEVDREAHSSDVKTGAIFITESGDETHEMGCEDTPDEVSKTTLVDEYVFGMDGEGDSEQPSAELEDENLDDGPASFTFNPLIKEMVDALRVSKHPKAKTVQHCALELLQVVLEVEEPQEGTTISWGASYEEVLEAIRSLFPDAKTSVQSLRWYNSKVRRGDEGKPWDGYEVPDRRYLSDRPEKAGGQKLARCPDCQKLHDLAGQAA
jgi:hypothetical protein